MIEQIRHTKQNQPCLKTTTFNTIITRGDKAIGTRLYKKNIINLINRINILLSTDMSDKKSFEKLFQTSKDFISQITEHQPFDRIEILSNTDNKMAFTSIDGPVPAYFDKITLNNYKPVNDNFRNVGIVLINSESSRRYLIELWQRKIGNKYIPLYIGTFDSLIEESVSHQYQ